MDYKKIIFNLLNTKKEKLLLSAKKYDEYALLEAKLNSVKEDVNLVLSIGDDDLKILNDDNQNMIIATAKNIVTYFPQADNEEIIRVVQSVLTTLKETRANDKEVSSYLSEMTRLNDVFNIVNENFVGNEDLIFDFIKSCYEEKLLTLDEAIKLNLYISSAKTKDTNYFISSVDDSNDDVQDDEIIVEENNDLTKEELIEEFSQYGYNYEELNSKIRDDIEKYAKFDNLKRVLKILEINNVDFDTFLKRQKVISRIIIFYDEEAINRINNFVSENKCTFKSLLNFGSIFFHRTKRFKIKSKESDSKGGTPHSGKIIVPCGDFENFMYCVDLYKKSKKLPHDYVMTDEDFIKSNGVGKATFFTTPKEVIQKNLKLLKKYKLIDGDKLPDTLTSLVGSNTEYLLDRIIESGLYNYVQKNMSILCSSNFQFRWYKIKRAKDLDENIFSNGGIRSELKSDNKNYNGIIYKTKGNKQVIFQQMVSISGGKELPEFEIQKIAPGQLELMKFKKYYEYRLYNPSDIFKYFAKNNDFPTKGVFIDSIFASDYSKSHEFNDGAEDYYIGLLDNLCFYDADGKVHNYCKVDDLTYNFYKPASEWPEMNICISRQKVLRLFKLLKESDMWIKDNSSPGEKINLLLSAIVKDTPLSLHEINCLRNIIVDLITRDLNKNNRKGATL